MDKKILYKTLRFLDTHNYIKKPLIILTVKSPIVSMILYFLAGTYLIISRSLHILIPYLVIPTTVFIIVTLIRHAINRKRPYEKYSITPLVNHKKGHSFPSRHSASAVITSMAVYYLNPYLGYIAIILSVIVCITRIFTLVHFLSDVLVGIAISIALGLIGFYIIF